MSLFTVAPTLPEGVCAQMLDNASAVAAMVDDDIVGVANPEGAAAARRRAVRMINALCGQCRACPRGRTGEGADALMAAAPQTMLAQRRDP